MTSQSKLHCQPMALAHHSCSDVAELILTSAPELFALLYGAQAIAYLTALVGRSHNRFSYQYIRLLEIDHKVVGVVTLVPAARLKDKADYRQVLTFRHWIWFNLVQHLFLPYVLRQDYPQGSFYIGNLAVAAEYRHQGMGRQLLRQCISEAQAASGRLFVSVDVSNQRAQTLYESLGFQEVMQKTLRVAGMTIGSRVLSLNPSIATTLDRI